jgi:hypothetical protein
MLLRWKLAHQLQITPANGVVVAVGRQVQDFIGIGHAVT